MTIAPLPATLFEAAAIPPASETAADATSGEGGHFLDLLSMMLIEGGDPAPQEAGEAEEAREHEHTPPPVAIETAPPPPPPLLPTWLAPATSDSEGAELPSPASPQTVSPEAAPQRTADATVAFTARLSDTSAPVAAPTATDASAAPLPEPVLSRPAERAPAAEAVSTPPVQEAGRSEFDGAHTEPASPAPAQMTEVPASPRLAEAETVRAKNEPTVEGTQTNRTLPAAPAVNATQPERPDGASEAAQSAQAAARVTSPQSPGTVASAQDHACKPEGAISRQPARPSDATTMAPPAQAGQPSQRQERESQTPRALNQEREAGNKDAAPLRRVAATERSEESRERTAQPERATSRESGPQPRNIAQPSVAPSHPSGPSIAHQPQRVETPLPQTPQPRPAMPSAALELPAPPEAPAPVRDVREVSIVLPASREGNPGPRVEVHLAERAGEVHVAVRTPDPQVRNALRSELPTLVDRLEQTGYKAEIFSPHSDRQAADQPHTRRAEAPAETAGHDNMSWNFDEGRRERRDPAPQRPHAPANRPNSEQRSFFHEFFR